MDLNEKEVEVTEEVTETMDAKAMGIEMAKAFVAEMKEAQKEVKEVKEVPEKVIKAHRVEVIGKTAPCGAFKNVDEMEMFAKVYVPKNLLEKFNNQKALTTYGNIGTAADGGNFDPTDVKGILADTVAQFPSYVEDTLQVPVFNSVGTFIDMTGTTTAYMIDEAGAITESKAEYTSVTLTQKKISCLAPITNELLRFGTLVDVASETLRSCGRAISQKKQFLIFDSDGGSDSTYGGLTGVVSAMDAVSPSDAAYEVSGTWSDIDNINISKIVAQVASWGNSAKFAWYMHSNLWGILEGIARQLGGNSYLIQVGQRPVPSLYGYPVKFVDSMRSSASTTKSTMLFGDLSACIATGSNGQVYIDSSDSFYFAQDTTTLRIIEHYGQNVYSPGEDGKKSGIVAVQFSEAS